MSLGLLPVLLVLAGGAGGPGQAAPAPAPKPRPTAPAGPTFEQVSKKAETARQNGQFDEAIRYYRQALQLKPDWIAGHWSLATLLYDQDKYEEARDHFRRVVQAQPKHALALALKGLCEFQLKNYDRALSELEKARLMGIPSPEVQSVASYQVATLLTRNEMFEPAFEVLRDFSLQDKDSQAVIEAFGLCTLRLPFLPSEAPADKREMILMAGRAGYQMAKGRRTPIGRMAFEELVARYGAEPNVHYAYGTFLLTDDADAALEEFRRELRTSPNHYHALVQIAYEYIKRGNFVDAVAPAEKAVELAPRFYLARNVLGRALLETGETDRAIQELESGVRLSPESPDLRFALARAYQRAGRKEDAERERAEFVRLDRLARALRAGMPPVGAKGEEPENPPEKN